MRTIAALFITAAMLCPGQPAAAEDKPFRFEITPFAAYRLGGQFEEQGGPGEFELDDSSAAGVVLNGTVRPDGQWEFLYARQQTDLGTGQSFLDGPTTGIDVEYFQFGGAYLLDGNKTRPFIAMTLGVTRFKPQPADLDAESYFSASLGVGVQLYATKRVGVRLEGRVFTTFLEDDSALFCRSDNGATCLIQVDATVLTQWEARAGLVFRF